MKFISGFCIALIETLESTNCSFLLSFSVIILLAVSSFRNSSSKSWQTWPMASRSTSLKTRSTNSKRRESKIPVFVTYQVWCTLSFLQVTEWEIWSEAGARSIDSEARLECFRWFERGECQTLSTLKRFAVRSVAPLRRCAVRLDVWIRPWLPLYWSYKRALNTQPTKSSAENLFGLHFG